MLNVRLDVSRTWTDAEHWYFQARSGRPITSDQAKEAQVEFFGLPVELHGFFDFKVSDDPVLLRYFATWKCNKRGLL